MVSFNHISYGEWIERNPKYEMSDTMGLVEEDLAEAYLSEGDSIPYSERFSVKTYAAKCKWDREKLTNYLKQYGEKPKN